MQPNPHELSVPITGVSVLVVDDESAIRELLAIILNRLGCDTACAADTAQALTLCRTRQEAGRPFHAAIVDLTLPRGERGTDLGRHLRHITPNLRLILTTGFRQEATNQEVRQLGFDAVLAKPFRLADVERVLREVLANSIHSQPTGSPVACPPTP